MNFLVVMFFESSVLLSSKEKIYKENDFLFLISFLFLFNDFKYLLKEKKIKN